MCICYQSKVTRETTKKYGWFYVAKFHKKRKSCPQNSLGMDGVVPGSVARQAHAVGRIVITAITAARIPALPSLAGSVSSSCPPSPYKATHRPLPIAPHSVPITEADCLLLSQSHPVSTYSEMRRLIWVEESNSNLRVTRPGLAHLPIAQSPRAHCPLGPSTGEVTGLTAAALARVHEIVREPVRSRDLSERERPRGEDVRWKKP